MQPIFSTPSRRHILTAAMALAIGSSAVAADFTMRISHQFPPTHHTALNLDQFAKEVKAMTKGLSLIHI